MRFNLKLSQKGFILVAVPLIFEVIFVVALARMLDQVEQERRVEQHSKAILNETNEMSNNFINSAQYVLVGNYARNQMFVDRYSQSAAAVRNGVGNLKELTKDNKEQTKHVKRIAELSERVLQFLASYIPK